MCTAEKQRNTRNPTSHYQTLRGTDRLQQSRAGPEPDQPGRHCAQWELWLRFCLILRILRAPVGATDWLHQLKGE